MHPIKTYVNGNERDLVVDPTATLLHVLRDMLGLTGTKEGCSTGYCGACTVLVDDKAINSCLYPAVDAAGREITTIEALAGADGALHALQDAFIDQTGVQCGFCTPGMILSAAAFLAENPEPTETQTRAALAGNLCRCTGYQSIVRAVLAAAGKLRTPGQAGDRRRAPIRTRA
jgi:carbon-monoxide dehydrogenase small subunit